VTDCSDCYLGVVPNCLNGLPFCTESADTVIYSHACVGYFKASCKVVHTSPVMSGSVTGIALLNDQLYVIHNGSLQIAVYCPTTLQFQQCLNFRCNSCNVQSSCVSQCNCRPQAYDYYSRRELQHMVECAINNCLYVSIQDNNYGGLICKVATDQNNTLSAWSVDSVPQGLSITSSDNLLVALSDASTFSEYSPDGQQIRQINLQPAGITNPIHIVELSKDQIGIVHYGPKHQFSIVDAAGQLIKSYSGDAGELNEPQGIAVDHQRGRVFLADRNNNRILVMNSRTLEAYQNSLLPVVNIYLEFLMMFSVGLLSSAKFHKSLFSTVS